RPGELLTEDSPAGEGFLAGVVSRWEAATARADDVTRVVHIRTGVVLADGGSLSPLLLATRLGAGATIGTGQQLWPWISLEDEVAAIVHLLTRSELSGPVNLTGPEPAPSAEITRLYARAMRRPHLLRVPDWLLRLVVGEPADEILLPDQRVVPTRLLADGFEFRHPTAQAAVAAARLRRAASPGPRDRRDPRHVGAHAADRGVDRAEALVDVVDPVVDLAETLVDVVEPLVDPLEPLVQPVEALVVLDELRLDGGELSGVLGDGGGDVLETRSEEHTSELQSRENLVCRLLLGKKNAER